jgi:hypothetical protein
MLPLRLALCGMSCSPYCQFWLPTRLMLPAYPEDAVWFCQFQCITLTCELPAADSGGADAVMSAVQQ